MKLICEKCKTEYSRSPSHAKNSRFCSRKCKDDSQLGKVGNRPSNRETSVCQLCGKVFEHWAGRKAKYCSKECWAKRNPSVLKECLLCDREFWAYKSGKKQYCSKKCYNIAQKDLQRGENSHFWDGGKTSKNKILRSRAEYTEWRLKVFVRDEYTCQDCGKKNGDGYKVYLQAHHIKPFAEYSDLRCEVSNGITLCKDCHREKHKHNF